jgi:multisubunit Na+/H+ antiporter MnhC subunit
MSPFLNIGIFFVTLGVLIILFPHLLQIIVALALISMGVSLISVDRLRRKGKNVWVFPPRRE